MTRIEVADNLFTKGYNCSQAVLASFAPDFGLESDLCHRIASGFGSGMGGMADTCGALTGAYMVIGLYYGGTHEQKQKTYEMVRRTAEKFGDLHSGHTFCKDLLGVDVSVDKGMRWAKKNKLFKIKCRDFVRDTVEILEEVIAQSDGLEQVKGCRKKSIFG